MHSEHSPLESFFFICDRFLQTQNSLLSFSLILVNFHHDLLELHFGLDSILFGFSLLLGFFTQDISLRFHAFLKVLGLKLGRNEVGLHSLEDMLVLCLRQFLKFVLFGEIIEFGLVVSSGALLMTIELSQINFLFTRLLQLPFQIIQFLLFGLHSLVDSVILLTQSFESSRHLFLFLATCFPLWDEVVWLQKGVSLHVRYFPLDFLVLWNRVLILKLLHDSGDVGLAASTSGIVILLWSSESCHPIARDCRLRLIRSHICLLFQIKNYIFKLFISKKVLLI